MKRGKPLRRGGPLVRRAPLVARAELTRKQPLQPARDALRRVPFRPQRPTVTPAERRARKLVKARANGACEGCGRPGPADYSHRVAQGQGGPWDPANALRLCRRQHRWAHRNPDQARDRLGWILRSTDDFLTRPAWVYGREWCLLRPDGSYQPVTDIPDDEAV